MHQFFNDEPEKFERLSERLAEYKKDMDSARDMNLMSSLLMKIGKSGEVHPESSYRLQIQGKQIGDEARHIIHVGRAIMMYDLEIHGMAPFYQHGYMFVANPFPQKNKLQAKKNGETR